MKKLAVMMIVMVNFVFGLYFCVNEQGPIPTVIQTESPVKYDYKGEYELTWYCEGTRTASENRVNHNLTAAADVKSGLKFNDVVYVSYLDKPVVIHDTGSAIKGNKGFNSETSNWTKERDAMCKKTVLIQLMKVLPKSIDMQRALAMDCTTKSSVEEDMLGVKDETNWNDTENKGE